MDVIQNVFYLKKVGHAGILDPQATGVLVILIGALTKKSNDFISHDKEYEVCLTLGIATDSQDGQGRIIKKQDIPNLSLQKIEYTFHRFLGKVMHIPPMFSALKYKGKKLYVLSREWIEVTRSLRRVYIYELKTAGFSPPHIYFKVKCSKGTYIRTLCADIAESLGCVGHMSQLRRINSGPFSINSAVNLDRLKSFSSPMLQEALMTGYS